MLLLPLNELPAQTIKSFPLDDRTVYHLKVGVDKVTTVIFPQPITALEGSGIAVDPKQPAKVLLSYTPGERFFSLRAEADSFTASLNVVSDEKVYVLELTTDPEPFQSVRFYGKELQGFSSQPGTNAEPSRLLALLDQAKAFTLLKDQYPEMVSQIDHAEPCTKTAYPGFDAILTQVFRFDPEDALVFALQFDNHTTQPIHYFPQSFAVRVGPTVYWSALAQGSGLIPPGQKALPGRLFLVTAPLTSSFAGPRKAGVTNSRSPTPSTSSSFARSQNYEPSFLS